MLPEKYKLVILTPNLSLFLCAFLFKSSDSSSEDEMTEEEIAQLKEAVEEKKKLITTLRNKPWKMKKKMEVLKYAVYVTLSLHIMSLCLF